MVQKVSVVDDSMFGVTLSLALQLLICFFTSHEHTHLRIYMAYFFCRFSHAIYKSEADLHRVKQGFSTVAHQMNSSLLRSTVSYIEECLAASVASPHQMPVAPLSSGVTTKNISRYCQMSCGRRNCPRLRTIRVNVEKM